MTLRRLLILCLLALAPLGCSGSPACTTSAGSASCLRVLFVGNSYTYVNDLPIMFTDLAASGGHAVATGMLATGGATLVDHAAAADTATALASTHWNVVVLQEQSQIPSVDAFREAQMYPAARQLVGMIRATGAEPIFFLTWAHRYGWPENGLLGYGSMQAAVDDGYVRIASEQHAVTAPVGYAWAALLDREPQAELWQSDGSHPTVEGTYLAACVFYTTIFGQSPRGLGYHGDLPDDEAATVQEIAAKVVLGDPARWVRR